MSELTKTQLEGKFEGNGFFLLVMVLLFLMFFCQIPRFGSQEQRKVGCIGVSTVHCWGFPWHSEYTWWLWWWWWWWHIIGTGITNISVLLVPVYGGHWLCGTGTYHILADRPAQGVQWSGLLWLYCGVLTSHNIWATSTRFRFLPTFYRRRSVCCWLLPSSESPSANLQSTPCFMIVKFLGKTPQIGSQYLNSLDTTHFCH
jgi:hypothetical protein